MIGRFLLAALLVTAGTVDAGGSGGPAAQVNWPQFVADSTCTPAIPNGVLKLGTKADAKASKQMKALYDADQADRKTAVDASVLPRDLVRRKKTFELLKSGLLSTSADLVGAAFVFQHGNCPSHFLLAHALADQAIKHGDNQAVTKFIFAATYDRWLVNIRKPQKYGTQLPTFAPFKKSDKLVQCVFFELPLDPSTTDAELARYGLPLIAEIKKRNEKIFQDYQNACRDVPKTSQKFYVQ